MKIFRPTRRELIRTTAAATAGAICAPAILSSARAAASKELVFVGFGGTYQDGQTKAYIEPFEKETGIKVIQTSGVELAKLRAQVQSKNVEWDIVTFPDRLRTTAVRDGLFMPLDFNVIDKSDIIPSLVTDYSVGHVSNAMQLTYASDYYKSGRQPKTWADFWNLSDIPGVRGMYNTPPFTLEIALLADGVSRESLYPLDVPRALKSLDRIKNKLVWWDQFPQPGVMLKTGQIQQTPWTRGPAGALFENSPIGVSFDDFIFTYEAWMVPKGAPHSDAAMKFIDFALKPERQAALTKFVTFGPSNNKAWQFIDPKVASWLPSYPENFKKGVLLNSEWWGDNLAKVNEQWTEWRLAK